MKRGTRRLGWLIDGDPDTPHQTVSLLDDGERITLRVPWRLERPNGPYHQWFHSDAIVLGDYPDPRPLPELLEFHDLDGVVTLVGCRVTGHRTKHGIAGPIGEGTIDVHRAVMGGRGNYRTINGLRTEIPGLLRWLGLRSITERLEVDERGRLVGVDLSLRSPEPIPLDRRMNLRLRPTFRWERSEHGDRISVFDAIQVETTVARPRPWADHLHAHRLVRELVEISAWQVFPESLLLANRATDPHRSLGGDDHGEKWNRVRTYDYRSGFDEPTNPRFLFAFGDVGPARFRKWVRLREHFHRGITPWMAAIGGTHLHLQSQVTEAGIGFEAIGYQLALHAGLSRKNANGESHEERLRRIVAQLPTVPVPDVDEWIAESCRTYNGLKHADRELPDIASLVNVQRRNTMVFRVWVAGQIGVPTKVLRHTVPTDPLFGEVSLIEQT